jgi:hypothetical protein
MVRSASFDLHGLRTRLLIVMEFSMLMVVHIKVVPLLATRHQVKFNSTRINPYPANVENMVSS